MRLLNLADLDPSDLAYPIFYDLEDEDVFLAQKKKASLQLISAVQFRQQDMKWAFIQTLIGGQIS